MRYPLRLWACVIGVVFLFGGCKREVAPMPLVAINRSMAMAAAPGPTDRRMAFSHSFVVELPSDAVEATQQKNLTDCLAAGCTVLATHIDRMQNGMIQGSILVRIAPDRYAGFATAITAPPAKAGEPYRDGRGQDRSVSGH